MAFTIAHWMTSLSPWHVGIKTAVLGWDRRHTLNGADLYVCGTEKRDWILCDRHRVPPRSDRITDTNKEAVRPGTADSVLYSCYITINLDPLFARCRPLRDGRRGCRWPAKGKGGGREHVHISITFLRRSIPIYFNPLCVAYSRIKCSKRVYLQMRIVCRYSVHTSR